MDSRPPILVVDDEGVVLAAVRRILSAESYPHKTAGSAEEALDVLKHWTPRILLADIKLPGKSGLELVEIVSDAPSDVVAIMMTGYATVEHVVLSLGKGAVDFLPKPFTFDELMSALARASRIVETGRPRVEVGEPEGEEEVFLLDGQTWVRRSTEGTALLGITRMFLQTIGDVARVSLPEPNTLLRQGGVLNRVVSSDGHTYRAWCAVSGRVCESNDDLATDCQLLVREPYSSGWVARVIPVNIDEELSRLQCPTASDAIR